MPTFHFERIEVTVYGPYRGHKDCVARICLLGTRFEKVGKCKPTQKSARELARSVLERELKELLANAETKDSVFVIPFYGLSVILKKEDDGVRVVSWYRTAASAKRAAAKFKVEKR
jgi:hypothetical protein